jgi:hypothetical protein
MRTMPRLRGKSMPLTGGALANEMYSDVMCWSGCRERRNLAAFCRIQLPLQDEAWTVQGLLEIKETHRPRTLQ